MLEIEILEKLWLQAEEDRDALWSENDVKTIIGDLINRSIETWTSDIDIFRTQLLTKRIISRDYLAKAPHIMDFLQRKLIMYLIL